MILKFRAEDLISVILEDLIQSSSWVKIEYRHVNNMREKLRLHGISNDLGIREIEAVSHNYPKNIRIERTSVSILKSIEFMEYFEIRVSKYEKEDFDLLKKMWKESE